MYLEKKGAYLTILFREELKSRLTFHSERGGEEEEEGESRLSLS